MFGWVLARLSEPSTWRGIIAIATGAGLVLSPEMQQGILAVGLSAIGLINIIRKEKTVAK